MVVGVNWCLAPELRAGDLAASVRDHLIHVHVELRATSRHPYMQGKHVMMLASEDLTTGLNDQFVPLVVEPPTSMIGIGSGFLQSRIGSDHFTRNQILPNTEVLKRALGLSAPQLVSRNIYFAEAIGFLPNVLLLH